MRHKRLKLSAVLLLGLGLTGLQAQTMYVKQSNGTQTAYALSNVRKMTFSAGNVTVQKTDNTTGVYALSGLKYLSFQDFTNGINEPQTAAGSTLYAYPNPVADMLTIDLTGTKNGEGHISILNLEGKVMQKQQTEGTGIVSLNLSQLPQGIYLCRYTNGTETKTVKIIKQ
ncbi:T9SS type A sorting domain-containing protein [Williamwhitmania taraxaci]|uniref:Por secretion system C-terminal sorting domain-containing protein n=1 Tax=Williamwhitmania taraxaci TaxID=1640674 RepID=A0A1G6SR53_9BACT|nr:T9SS type A sorting domain-containing protein [Williamwhitmania taraxaci]SDD19390.1 Por secretion system C-terminal sorting domain-containing protein [Williamwhitmania taraxaci]